ncbi:MAG: TonB-dependent receptor [Cryomorphaceae bacterium]
MVNERQIVYLLHASLDRLRPTLGGLLATALFLISASIAFSQSTLTGVIKDKETGETLPGATVVIVGTYLGASSDIDGKYIIEGIKPGDYSIKVTFIGYSDQVYNGIRLKKDATQTLDAELSFRSNTLQEVIIVGESVIDLESGKSEVRIDRDAIAQMAVRDVQDVVKMQAGVSENPDGIQIRGGRVYETQYVVDGISAQDPLAGTGFGVNVSSSSIEDLKVVTGGASAEYGDGSSGVISTQIREGGDKLEVSGRWLTDNYLTNRIKGSSWNTDNWELTLATPIPGTKKKLTLFTSASVQLTDTYFGEQADQLHSSLFFRNDSLWAPRQDNRWSNTVKLAYTVRPGFKLFFTNQHSLNINQNTRSLQIVGFNTVVQPGYQYDFSNELDNATTYTHQSNLSVLGLTYSFPSNKWSLRSNFGRLFTNLRADANGRPFREETIDQIYDPRSIITDPVSIFNPGDDVVYVNAPSGLINNDGISTVWHDHYVQEYTIKNILHYYPESKIHKWTFGQEHKETQYQWADVSSPWVGAPIQINDTFTTPSISVGSSNDIWKANAANGGLFAEDNMTYKGISATLAFRLNYWAYGSFVDDAIEDPDALIIQEVRSQYAGRTIPVFGRRFQARFLPRLNVSFPVTENNVLYFNYGHSMRLPHPRFIYAGLDPVFQDRGYLSRIGNPNLKPETTVSYELGIKSQVTKDLGITFAAFNNDKYDYIVTRTIVLEDQTGRLVDRTTSINQDYARIIGLELGVNYRLGKYLRTFFNGAYQVATGKSNSAAESLLQIRQTGFVNTTKEQYLAWDRPWDFKAGITFLPDSNIKIGRFSLQGFRAFLSGTYKSGLRYTPHVYNGTNDIGRPLYVRDDNRPNANIGQAWTWVDLKITRDFVNSKGRGLSISIEIKNMFNRRNTQIVNPVTGRAYEYGDPVPDSWRDLAYPDPLDRSEPPTDPARYTTPRQILYGISFKF